MTSAENCGGTSATCPADTLLPSSAVCRAAAGPCDIAENCSGSSTNCPPDSFEPSSTVCRAAADICDAAEVCSGVDAPCPADGFLPSSTVCRPVADVCDVAESCTGKGVACPADGFASSTVVCRASAGVCDVAESCTGAGSACPANGFAASTTVCRPSAGPCDVDDNCTGSGPACAVDQMLTPATVSPERRRLRHRGELRRRQRSLSHGRARTRDVPVLGGVVFIGSRDARPGLQWRRRDVPGPARSELRELPVRRLRLPHDVHHGQRLRDRQLLRLGQVRSEEPARRDLHRRQPVHVVFLHRRCVLQRRLPGSVPGVQPAGSAGNVHGGQRQAGRSAHCLHR